MKAHVREVELEGTAREIADVIAATITARTPQLHEPAPVAEAIVVEPSPTPTDTLEQEDQRRASERAEPAFGVTRAEDHEPTQSLAVAAFRAAGVDVDETDEVHEPALTWQDVPVEYRWWNDAMTTCHIRQRPAVDLALCKLNPAKIGHRHTAFDAPPAETIASVCGNCRRRMSEAARR